MEEQRRYSESGHETDEFLADDLFQEANPGHPEVGNMAGVGAHKISSAIRLDVPSSPSLTSIIATSHGRYIYSNSDLPNRSVRFDDKSYDDIIIDLSDIPDDLVEYEEEEEQDEEEEHEAGVDLAVRELPGGPDDAPDDRRRAEHLRRGADEAQI